MDGDPPPRRPAAGRLPHPVARRRHRPGRPARIPAPRRRAPHRLERHRAAADALRAPVHRRPRAHRLVPARPVGQRRLRLGRRHQAGGVDRLRRAAGARAHAPRQPRRRDALRQPGRRRAAAAQRRACTCWTCCSACAAAAARPRPRQRHLAGRPAAHRRRHDQAPLAGVRGLRLHQRSPAGRTRWRAWRSATRWSRCACTTRWRWRCPTSAW